jgi:hypothetical protein
MTTILLYGLIYLAVIAFVVGCVIRAVQYARMPVHLRWDRPHGLTAEVVKLFEEAGR